MEHVDIDEVKRAVLKCVQEYENSYSYLIDNEINFKRKNDFLKLFGKCIYQEMIKGGANVDLKADAFTYSINKLGHEMQKSFGFGFNFISEKGLDILVNEIWKEFLRKPAFHDFKDKNQEEKREVAISLVLDSFFARKFLASKIDLDEDKRNEYADMWKESQAFLPIRKKLIEVMAMDIINHANISLEMIEDIVSEAEMGIELNHTDLDFNKNTTQKPRQTLKNYKIK